MEQNTLRHHPVLLHAALRDIVSVRIFQSFSVFENSQEAAGKCRHRCDRQSGNKDNSQRHDGFGLRRPSTGQQPAPRCIDIPAQATVCWRNGSRSNDKGKPRSRRDQQSAIT